MKVKKMFTVIALCLISVCSVFAQHRYDEDLLRACKGNSLRDVQKYLAAGADPNAWQLESSGKYTALSYACRNGNVPMAEALVDKGAYVDVSEDFEVPLLFAIEKTDLKMLNYLVKVCKANTNIRNLKKKTPLMFAAESNNADVMKLILSSDFGDVNSLDDCGRNALHYAVECTNTAVFDVLVRKGIDVYHCDDEGYSPFMRAAIEQNTNMVTYFLTRVPSFDVNRKDDKGFPPLLLCIKNRVSITLIKRILEYGNEPTSVVDVDGHDIYYYLNRWGTKEMRDAVNEAIARYY